MCHGTRAPLNTRTLNECNLKKGGGMERSLTSNWAWRRGSKEKDLVKNEENTIPREENVTLKKKKSENPKFTHSFTLETQLWTSQKNSSCPRGAHATDSAEISVIIILDAAGSRKLPQILGQEVPCSRRSLQSSKRWLLTGKGTRKCGSPWKGLSGSGGAGVSRARGWLYPRDLAQSPQNVIVA